MPDTYFAPAARADGLALQADIGAVSNHPITDALLHSVNGLLAVLNQQRQIISVNDTFLKALDLNNLDDVLSLRPGEAVHCIHAFEKPNGCGTTKFCASCGAAIAIVSSLEMNLPAERTCALTAQRGGKTVEICLSVRTQPLTIEGRRYLLLFLHDITKEQFLLSLERTFFHDINNILAGLLGQCELHALKNGNPPEIQNITNLVLRVSQEMAIQKTLSNFGDAGLKPIRQAIASEHIIQELKTIFSQHPASHGKTIKIENHAPGRSINSDMALLLRVLCNMVTNALESTETGGEVKVWIEESVNGGMCIKAWNKAMIPHALRPRIFQRHFSTKAGLGRGFGTYSMMLFGKDYLGGEVSFVSTEADGTIFCMEL